MANPYNVELLLSILFKNETEARNAESRIHTLFHKTRLSGEWFQATQFMLSFIKNIKENGWESYLSWLDKQYQEEYGAVLNTVESKLEGNIIRGNFVFKDRLKSDLEKLLDITIVTPSLPTSMAEAVRDWIEKREDPFTLRDVYFHFDIRAKKGKRNISKILSRLVEVGRLEKTGKFPKYIFRKT